jgi:hypothetical protein
MGDMGLAGLPPSTPVPVVSPSVGGVPGSSDEVKTIFLFAGMQGGVGKSLLASNLIGWLRLHCSPAVGVRGFDLDPHGGLSRFYPALVERVDGAGCRELLGVICADAVHSVFVIDPPGGGGSEGLLKSVFRGYDPVHLAFRGFRVVLVVVVGGEHFSLRGLPYWMEFAGSEILLVYRRPVLDRGREVCESAELADVPLPLWLEMVGGSPVEAGWDGIGMGGGRIRRMMQPNFKPRELVEHLFRRGISLYQAAYPYSRWAGAELEEEELFRRRQAINRLVGAYWISRKQYEGVGYQFGYQLSFWLDLLYIEFARVFRPLFSKDGVLKRS